jgi:selenocysteine lyase/cysteine desulfurase
MTSKQSLNTSLFNRRQFLQNSLLAAGALASQQSIQAQAADHASTPANDEDFWEQVRAQFSFLESRVPMNAANLCPSFRAVAETVERVTFDIDADCSFNNRAKYSTLLEQAREMIAAQLKVSADEIALVRNTSEANNMINNGLDLQAGDEVLIWDQNHPTNNVAWDVRAARFGIQTRRLSTPAQPQSQQQLIEAFTREFSPQTRVLALTHVSNVSGIKLPVKAIIEAAHERGIYVHVDGAQSWGAFNLDLKDIGADSYSASAHKWFMGPKEVGLLYVAEENIDRVWPSEVAPGWGNDAEADPIGARKFESLGQRDDAALAALATAAQLHNQIGLQRIEDRIVSLSQRLKRGILDAGLELVTPFSEELSHGVCITSVAGGGGELVNRLYADYGLAAAPTGGLRLSPTIYNTEAHIDRAINALTELLA